MVTNEELMAATEKQTEYLRSTVQTTLNTMACDIKEVKATTTELSEVTAVLRVRLDALEKITDTVEANTKAIIVLQQNVQQHGGRWDVVKNVSQTVMASVVTVFVVWLLTQSISIP